MQMPRPVLYLQLCTQTSQECERTLPITISAPSGERHPLEVEVEKTKHELMMKRESRLSLGADAADYDIVHTVSSDFLQQNALVPLSVINCGSSPAPLIDNRCSREEAEEEQVETCTEQPTLDDEPDPLPSSNPVAEGDVGSGGLVCHLCDKRFVHKKNVYAHMRGVHSCEPVAVGGLICPLCRMNFLRHVHLRHHFHTLHHKQIHQSHHQFTTLAEFQAWKEMIEKNTNSYFVSKCAARTLALNQCKQYYKCHRSGKQQPAPPSSRSPNAKMSYKMGATCPAGMEVTETSDGISVTYWETHVGHDEETQQAVGSTNLIDSPHHRELDNSSSSMRIVKRARVDNESSKSRRGRHTSYAMLLDKARHLVQLLENGDVEPESRTLISNMIDNVRSVVVNRYRPPPPLS